MDDIDLEINRLESLTLVNSRKIIPIREDSSGSATTNTIIE